MGKPLRILSPSISKKHKREDDRGVNELPDEVLILILSHMPTKAAATTSVLSRRWKKLWTFHPSLVFDGSKELLNLDYHLRGLRTDDYMKKKECLASERVKYIHWVNHILESHHAPTIEEFKIRFNLNKHYQSDIDERVRFAFGKQVKAFELDLRNNLGRIHDEEPCCYYKLCTRTLGLLQTPISLTSLVLKQVNVSGEVVENLISNSPFLDSLCVVRSNSLVHLRVAAPSSLCLTHLKIISCAKLKGLELNVPNLVSLIYSGPSIKIRFTKDPLNLAKLCMGGSYVENCICNNMLPLVPRFASQLQKLGVMMYVCQIRMQRLEYPIMNQVKQLEVKVIAFDHDSLLFLSSLIEACPCLNHFALEITAWIKLDRRRESGKKVKSRHDNLKMVEITGFVGRRVDTEFCKYLIKSAVMLERMSIDPLPSYIKGTASINDEPERVRAAREKAEKLRSKYELHDKLVIL